MASIRSIAGRIFGIDEKAKVAYLELFEPMSIMTPVRDLVPEKITKDMMLDVSWAYGRGLYRVLKEKALREDLVPPGEWTEDGKVYRLSQAVPLAQIKEVCQELYPNKPECWYQGFTTYVLPLSTRGKEWYPLRLFEADQAKGMVQYEAENPWE